ncbi:MAG TPA: polysaccharide deacetylase family protein [Pseudonocardiaceae bacterium]|nr:polysaccharide deacetylase family protein [Pseudonocardiaceae bacterium]
MSQLSRRRALGLSAGAAIAAVAGCSTDSASPSSQSTSAPATTTSAQTPVPATTVPPTTPIGGPAVQLARGASGRPEVALTFHGAGDLSITRQVLAALAAGHAQATVLAVGTWLAASPDGVRMVRDGGHEIGNHTWSHGDLAAMEPNPMLVEITRCRDKLADILGTPGTFFRQSQGQHATQQELIEAGQAGYARVLSYDIDSTDWEDPGPAAVRQAVTKATAGSVVSMHLGHQGTVLALPGILRDLADRGLTPVTATELLR